MTAAPFPLSGSRLLRKGRITDFARQCPGPETLPPLVFTRLMPAGTG
jgi:hypothetical protein